MKAPKGRSYAYLCDKKACNGSCPKTTPCMHTLKPEHSVSLKRGKSPVFVRVAKGRFFEVDDLSKISKLDSYDAKERSENDQVED